MEYPFLVREDLFIRSIKWPTLYLPSTDLTVELMNHLTHWGRATHRCVCKLTIIGPDNGLAPDRHQVIIWINSGIWLIRTLGTSFSEIVSEIDSFSFKKIPLKMSFGKWRPFCLGFNGLIFWINCYLVYWRIYASLVLSVLTKYLWPCFVTT